MSGASSRIHLIESVEVVTHHEDEAGRTNVHKVDINRLQIREKKADVESKRFRVDFKQEEVIDLRDDSNNISGNGPEIDQGFARKFVDQLCQVDNSRHVTSCCSTEQVNNDEDRTELDESMARYEMPSFRRLTGKSSMEILESLHSMKSVAEQLTESVYENQRMTSDLLEINEFLIKHTQPFFLKWL